MFCRDGYPSKQAHLFGGFGLALDMQDGNVSRLAISLVIGLILGVIGGLTAGLPGGLAGGLAAGIGSMAGLLARNAAAHR